MRKSYAVEPTHRLFVTNHLMVKHEIRPGNTVTLCSLIDLTEVEEIRKEYPKLSYNTFVIKAIALALREMPTANQRVYRPWLGWNVRLVRFCMCDVAVAVERHVAGAEGVSNTEVIRSADTLSLHAISEWLRRVSEQDPGANRQWRAYARLVSCLPIGLAMLLMGLPLHIPSLWVRYRGAAAILSTPVRKNHRVDRLLTAWPWPIGISFGAVKPRPMVVNGTVVAQPSFELTMNLDRRVMAGAPAVRFFDRMVHILENAHAEFSGFLTKRIDRKAA